MYLEKKSDVQFILYLVKLVINMIFTKIQGSSSSRFKAFSRLQGCTAQIPEFKVLE